MAETRQKNTVSFLIKKETQIKKPLPNESEGDIDNKDTLHTKRA